MFGLRLAFPLGVSLLIHLSVILLFFGTQSSFSRRLPSASLGVLLKPVAQSRYHASGGLERRLLPAPEEGVAKSVDSATESGRGTDQVLPVAGVFEAGELDGGIALVSVVSIEPEYGFADDVKGSVEISVLVTPDGKAGLVWHAPTDLDQAAVMYMTNALRVAKFSAPKKSGFPVFGIFRMRVEVGGLYDDSER